MRMGNDEGTGLRSRARIVGQALFLGTLVLGCAPTLTYTDPPAEQAPALPSRALVLIGRSEPSTLAGTLLLALGTGANARRRPFNAGLAIGRPRIDRLRFIFISDPNAALATLFAGEAHMPVDVEWNIHDWELRR
jgi:hypothetical protein